MKCTKDEYKRHFSKFSDRLFILHEDCQIQNLTQDEHFLLKVFGLPDCGLPFFRFDLSLQYLRDIEIEDSLFILGSPINHLSDEYIFIAKDHSIKVRDKEGHVYFLNSSLRQLINCIYIYSEWLETIERSSYLTEDPVVSNEEVFDMYYRLRDIDREGISQQSIWREIIYTDIQIPLATPELV